MNGENLIEWECGFYGEFRQRLYEGEIDLKEVSKLYKEKRITPYQYNFAIEYLSERN